MIGFAEPHPHLLPKPEERRAQQCKCREEKHGGTPDVLQPGKSEKKSHDNERRCAYPTGKRQACRAVQKVDPPAGSDGSRPGVLI